MDEKQAIRGSSWCNPNPNYQWFVSRLDLDPSRKYGFMSFRIAKHRNRSRAIRGSSWFSRDERQTRSSRRAAEDAQNEDLGFRIMRRKM